jgi:hypothetical protein
MQPFLFAQATMRAWRKPDRHPPQYRVYLQDEGVPAAWLQDAQDRRSWIEVVGEWSLVLHAAEGDHAEWEGSSRHPVIRIMYHCLVVVLGDLTLSQSERVSCGPLTVVAHKHANTTAPPSTAVRQQAP